MISLTNGIATKVGSILYVKRDQRKGFDYLQWSAFRHAVRFLNLPQAVLEFDRAQYRRYASE